ncbi:pentatricopeptide repeat-containing protein At4g21170-like [Salvia splendens]|uniref:pentatricopeptide repeat-containing protein At4g21170-like n=1 Tax=Salvia splendens TaxID=180675 RepID=UPI001C25D5E1|nr:pentatricopeptide repeat-containing protein At4g21170-like [Salvia splendens]
MRINNLPQIPNIPKFLKSGSENSSSKWRTQINQTQLVSQASTILLQRHPKLWPSLLKPLQISPSFTPSLFHQILNRIRTQPKLCFDFFNWARKNLSFKPDIGARSELTRILFGSELSELGKPILNSIVLDCPPAKIVALFQPRRNAGFQNVSNVLNSVIECYCSERMYFQSLDFYQMVRKNGARLSVDASCRLLNLLVEKNELRLAWCFYASIVRDGVLGNQCMWSVVAKILYKDGKFERIGGILEVGVCSGEMFDLIIDGYSKRGDFGAALDYLRQSIGKGIGPGFSTCSSILDGACRYNNGEVIENVLSFMVEKGLILKGYASDYDLIIKKLCGVGKTFAMDLFFKRACTDDVDFEYATYECMFMALLCEGSRVEDAIDLYNIMKGKRILLSKRCYDEFVIALCQQNPSLQISNLLGDIIRRGVASISPAKELSNYVRKQCAERQWREAEELLELVLDREWLLDPQCCGSFVRRYCSTRRIDRAILLHNKLEELQGTLATDTYNILVAALLRGRRTEEAMKVFDYMKRCKTVDSESFALMIRGLCEQKKMRMAMKLHDEMSELGLKPDQRTYKRLITGFR